MRDSRRRGRADQRASAALAPIVATGLAICWRCDRPIDPTEPWDAGHRDSLALGGDPDAPRVPEHRRCNRSDGAQLGRQLRAAPQSRRRLAEWLAVFLDRLASPSTPVARFLPTQRADLDRNGRIGIAPNAYRIEVTA